MKIMNKTGRFTHEKTELLAVTCFEDKVESNKTIKEIDKRLRGMIRKVVNRGDFTGKESEKLVFYLNREIGAERLMLVGLGAEEKFNMDSLRRTVGNISVAVRDMGVKNYTFVLPELNSNPQAEISQVITEGSMLALYEFNEYKTDKKDDKKQLSKMTILNPIERDRGKIQRGVDIGGIISESAILARDLINHPGNKATPTFLANTAKEIAKKYRVTCKVYSEQDLKKLKMGAILAVAQGSQEPPKFITMEYNANRKNMDTIVLVGKGITFDSGGISIKPSDGMWDMKYDMSGGAAVIATMEAVARLKIPLHVVGLVPSTENLPSGTAIKPGDIVKASSGKTIEILNTDAEGRLVLADALHFATKYKPNAIIDLATLTGACIVALGDKYIGLMSNNDELAEKVLAAAESTSEKAWRLPLPEEYEEMIKGDTGDIKNIGAKGKAGTIAGGLFLKHFVKDFPWVHLDIAGSAWTEKDSGYLRKGATGVGVRLLVNFLLQWAEGKNKE